MFRLDYASRHRVLRISLGGVLNIEAIAAMDDAIIAFIRRQGGVHRLIDLSAVTAVDITNAAVVRRGGADVPQVVRSMAEALAALGLEDPRFEPVAPSA